MSPGDRVIFIPTGEEMIVTAVYGNGIEGYKAESHYYIACHRDLVITPSL